MVTRRVGGRFRDKLNLIIIKRDREIFHVNFCDSPSSLGRRRVDTPSVMGFAPNKTII